MYFFFLQFTDLLKDPHSNSAENGTKFTDYQTANALENCSEDYKNETGCVNAIASRDNDAGKKMFLNVHYVVNKKDILHLLASIFAWWKVEYIKL